MLKKLGGSAVTIRTNWKCGRYPFRNLTTPPRMSPSVPVVDKTRPSSAPSTSTKKIKKPFLKRVFAGEFDNEVLIFPEVVHSSKLEEVRTKWGSLNESLKKIGEKSSSALKEKLQFLARSGVHMTEEGEASSFVFQCESLDLSPSLALALEIQHSYVIQLISKYGTEVAKEKYLPKLLSGELVGACALVDRDICGSDLSSMKSTIINHDDVSTYCLNGEKQWVTNAEFADIFIVSAFGENPSFAGKPEYSAAIVEKKSDQVKIEKINSTVLKNLGIANVKFQRVLVPEENLINDLEEGFSLAEYNMKVNTNFVFAGVLSCMKKFLSEAIRSVVPKVQSSAFLKDCEMIKKSLTKVAMTTYVLESMMYLKAGLEDSFIIDTSLESAVIKMFCQNECVRAMEECLHLLGAQAFDESLPYASIFNDCRGMLYSFGTANTNKLYVGLKGVHFAGKMIGETIRKNRRPLDYPGFVWKKLMSHRKNEVDNPNLTLKLYLNLHQTLTSSAEALEYCVIRLQYAVESILIRHGTEIVHRQLELERLATAACLIFAMTSVCARSSRAYCTGIKFSEVEIQHAVTFCADSREAVQKCINDLLKGPMLSNDFNYLRNCAEFVTNKSYIFEHPLVKNIE